MPNDMVDIDMSNMTVTVTEDDLLAAVRRTSMLADISISVWGGTRTDKALMKELKEKHGASGDVGRVIKNTMCGADALLKATHAAFTAVRLKHYALTQPWVSNPNAMRREGPRLLSNLHLDRYLLEVGEKRRAAFNRLDELCEAWPELVPQAKENLGTMVGNTTYPSADELRRAFSISTTLTPVPDCRGFQGHNDLMLERLSKSLQKRQFRQRQLMEAAIWQRAEGPVRKLIEKLETKDTLRRDALNTIRELLVLIPGWNVTQNPQIEGIVDDLRELVGEVEADKGDDKTSRNHLIQQARNVASRLAKGGM